MTGMAEVKRKTEALTRGLWFTPTSAFGRELDDRRGTARMQRARIAVIEPARLTQHVEQKLHVIAFRCHREFVQKTLYDERKHVRTGRAPRAARRIPWQVRLCEAIVLREGSRKNLV